MYVNRMFLYTRCPLRKGLDVLAPKKHANGIGMNLFEMLDEEIDGVKIPRFSVDLGASPAARVIPDGDRFEITISHDLPPNGARAINYAVVDHSGGVGFLPQDFTGFFVTLRQVINDEQGNARGYVFEFERDTLNTAIMQRRVWGINGGRLLNGRLGCQDYAGSGSPFAGAKPIADAIPDASGERYRVPVRSFSPVNRVRVLAFFSVDISINRDDETGDLPISGGFWICSNPINYAPDAGGGAATADALSYGDVLRAYGFLSTANYIIPVHIQNGKEVWALGESKKVKPQRVLILPEQWVPQPDFNGDTEDENNKSEYVFLTWEDTYTPKDFMLDGNRFFRFKDTYGARTAKLSAGFPAEYLSDGIVWGTPQARARFSAYSVGTKTTRIPVQGYGESAQIEWAFSYNNYVLSLRVGETVKELTDDYEAPLLTDLAQELKAQAKTTDAISAVTSAVAIVAGVATQNYAVAGGGAAGLFGIIGSGIERAKTPAVLDYKTRNAFLTLYGQKDDTQGTLRGGVYWECMYNKNAQVLGRYLAAFGELLTAAPVVGLSDVFAYGTRDFNCLYFKIAGGVIDGDINAEDGAAVLEAMQDGLRFWKDWRKMKLADYGS